MKTIYLVRHGRTRSNEEGRFQGWEDHPLSPVGQEQALSLKKRARDLMVTALYTSDLMRTRKQLGLLLRKNNLSHRPLLHSGKFPLGSGKAAGSET